MLATTVLLLVAAVGALAVLDVRSRRRLRLEDLRARARGPRPEPRSSAVRIIDKGGMTATRRGRPPEETPSSPESPTPAMTPSHGQE